MGREIKLKEAKYHNLTLEYKLVVVLEDVLGKIRYINIPSPAIDLDHNNMNVDIPYQFYDYREGDDGSFIPGFNVFGDPEFYNSFFDHADEAVEGFVEYFFELGFNELWVVPIKEIKAIYYEFVYTHPFVFTTSDRFCKLVDGTPAVLGEIPLVAL